MPTNLVMKKFIRYILFIIVPVFAFSCGKDNGNGNTEEKSSSYNLQRDEIIGEWFIDQAKFDKEASMTDWELESTTFNFKENGFFEAKGYFGSGTGSFSIKGATITTVLDNKPFINFEVYGIEDEVVDLVATIQSSKQRVWMTWYKPKYVDGGGYQDVWATENGVQIAILGVYSKLINFVVSKQAIENDIFTRHFETLSPSGSEILKCWNSAYESLYRINEILSILNENSDYKTRYAGHIYHLRVLRGYIVYNLATLWGRARYEETKHDPANLPPVLDYATLLQIAEANLSVYATDYSMKDVEKQKYFNPDAAEILLAEVSLTTGNKESAKTHLEPYATNTTSTDLYFEFIESDVNGQVVQTIPVYTKTHAELLYKEADGQFSGLSQSWRQANLQYGFWQMLKRCGWAESYMGCETYQLLFPYPAAAVSTDLPQNPGY